MDLNGEGFAKRDVFDPNTGPGAELDLDKVTACRNELMCVWKQSILADNLGHAYMERPTT